MLLDSGCLYCKNFIDDKKFTCKAFPDGIPKDVLVNENITNHSKVIEGQQGNYILDPDDEFLRRYAKAWKNRFNDKFFTTKSLSNQVR